MKRVLRGGRLRLPDQGIDQVQDVWLDGSRIAGLGQAPEADQEAYQVVDVSDCWLLPAAIDLQADVTCHTATEQTAAAAAGVGALLCGPTSHNRLDSPALVEHLLREGAGQVTRTLPLGALTRELAGEQLADYGALQAAGCVGLSNGGQPVANASVLRNAMKYAASLDLTVYLQPGDPALTDGCAHEGPMATRLGLPAIPAVAETAGLARDLELVADTGARVHFTRLSCARSVQLIREAREQGLPVSADVSIAHLLLTDHDLSGFNALCHVIPPLRSTTDRQALIDGVAQGVISAVCSDHRPVSGDAKLAPFAATEPGMTGLETLWSLAMRLVDDGALDFATMLAALTAGPAEIAGLASRHLDTGCEAQLVVWNKDAFWRPQESDWLSAGRSTPFGPWELKGRVRALY